MKRRFVNDTDDEVVIPPGEDVELDVEEKKLRGMASREKVIHIK